MSSWWAWPHMRMAMSSMSVGPRPARAPWAAPAGRRRARLGHLRAQRHAHGRRLVVHAANGAEVADHRGDHGALPLALFAAEALAAAEADHRGVDRFLPEGAEAFALKRGA